MGGAMGKVLIDIKDKSKENIVLNLLRELSFIEFKELGKANKTRNKILLLCYKL